MSLSAASQTTRRARLAKAAGAGAGLLTPSSAAVICHRQQQTRGFRFNRLWTSYFDPEFHRNVCRRHSQLRYKYYESLNQRSSWEKDNVAGDVQSTLKRMVNNYWHPDSKDKSYSWTHANLGATSKPQKTSDNPSGIRPGQNIEDAERAPLEHLLFGKDPQKSPNSQLSSSCTDTDASYIIDPITNRKVFKNSPKSPSYKSQFASFIAPSDDADHAPIFYDGPPPESELKMYSQIKIDPTPWKPGSQAPTLQTSNREQVTPNKTPTSSLLSTLTGKQKEVSWHHSGSISPPNPWTAATKTDEYKDLDKYKPVVDEVQQGPDQMSTQKYDDIDQYETNRYQESESKVAEEPSASHYHDLSEYGSVLYREPNGKDSAEQPVKAYEDLDKYGAFRYQEPDGKAIEDQPEQPYEDLGKYGPVRYQEPDGKAPEDQAAQPYEDLVDYTAFRSHEPDGKYKSESLKSVNPEKLKEYETILSQEMDDQTFGPVYAEPDLDPQEQAAYSKPVLSHEPDGKYAESYVRPTYDEAELAKYQAFRSHEPDGKYAAAYVAPQYASKELGKYGAFRSHEPDGKYAANHIQPEADASELKNYGAFRSHEPDGKYAVNYVEPETHASELGKYGPLRSHEPDGKYAASQVESEIGAAELDNYGPLRSHEPNGKYASQPDDSPDSVELGRYQAFRSHEPDGKYASTVDSGSPDSVELSQYQAFRSHEPDGKYVAQNDPTPEEPDLGNHEAYTIEDSETKTLMEQQARTELPQYKAVLHNEPDGRPLTDMESDNHHVAELSKYNAVRWNEPDGKVNQPAKQAMLDYDKKQGRKHSREKLESLMSRSFNEADAADAEALVALEDYRTKKEQAGGLSGNYVKDFPDEFVKSWKPSSDSDSSLLPSDFGKDSAVETLQEEGLFGTSKPLQPALERHQKPGRTLASMTATGQLDPYSKEPQGLETSYAEECGENVATFVSIYGTPKLDSTTTQTTSPSSEAIEATSPKPTIYKILAYNPTMQDIDVAETSSHVADTTTPLTPAEVVLRLSNPAKFFPHFGPLQAQGFEIVSGNGDVLIFRKVTEAVVEQGDAGTAAASATPPINPIDMTGVHQSYSVAAGRFASPTGFVNYNLPPFPTTASVDSSPRFLPDTDAFHKESSSSGAKEEPEQKGRSKKSLPKRVAVGAAWVAGLSYSLGVVGDYFKTGGSDGKGPKGRL